MHGSLSFFALVFVAFVGAQKPEPPYINPVRQQFMLSRCEESYSYNTSVDCDSTGGGSGPGPNAINVYMVENNTYVTVFTNGGPMTTISNSDTNTAVVFDNTNTSDCTRAENIPFNSRVGRLSAFILHDNATRTYIGDKTIKGIGKVHGWEQHAAWEQVMTFKPCGWWTSQNQTYTVMTRSVARTIVWVTGQGFWNSGVVQVETHNSVRSLNEAHPFSFATNNTCSSTEFVATYPSAPLFVAKCPVTH